MFYLSLCCVQAYTMIYELAKTNPDHHHRTGASPDFPGASSGPRGCSRWRRDFCGKICEMSADEAICCMDMTLPGALRALEARICRLLLCHPSRVAVELQVKGYLEIRNAVLRHTVGLMPPQGFGLHGDSSQTTMCTPPPVRFPQGLVLAVEMDGPEQCVCTLRWDGPVFSGPGDGAPDDDGDSQ